MNYHLVTNNPLPLVKDIKRNSQREQYHEQCHEQYSWPFDLTSLTDGKGSLVAK
jgi:hypothetical protein